MPSIHSLPRAVFCIVLLLTCRQAAAVAVAEVSLPGAVPIRVPNAALATARQENVRFGANDFFPDTARATADAPNGVLRTFVLRGGDFANTFGAATASLRDRVTITGPAGAAAGAASFVFDFSASTDSLTIETGGPVGGQAQTRVSVFASVQTFPAQGGVNPLASRTYALDAGHFFTRGENPSVIEDVTPFLSVGRNELFRNRDPSNVVRSDADIRLNLRRQNLFGLAGRMSFDMQVAPGDVLELFASLQTSANGPDGHAARASGENTGYVGIVLPEGWGFEAAGGELLRNVGVGAPVPLPASALLFVSGLCMLAVRRRRHPQCRTPAR
jgi:hypothetical protein